MIENMTARVFDYIKQILPIKMQRTAISLGFNCVSGTHAKDMKWKKTRAEGYKTCVFDLMISNYSGVIRAIKEDFAGFCDPQNLTLKRIFDGDECIYNTKYRFLFNHESDSKELLKIYPRDDPLFYIKNNYANFIERYQRRIQNFRDYLNGDMFIDFVMNYPIYEVPELIQTIREVYPNLKFRVILLNKSPPELYKYLIRDMDFGNDTKEYILAQENKIVKAYYGIPQHYINIDVGKYRTIPLTDHERASLFGDPIVGVKKHILVGVDGIYKIYHIGESVVLPLYREETFIDVF